MSGRHYKRWSAKEDRQLRMLWGTCTLKELAVTMGRTEVTTYWRGRKLGLTSGAPRGFEYLSHAAKRVGYATSQLRRILRAAGVPMSKAIARPTGKRKQRCTHFVEQVEVDRAVERWCRQETVEAAAERLGINSDTLRELLAAAGLKRPARAKAHWRLESEVIERVFKAWCDARAGRMSLRHHAKRLGMNHSTLAYRLRKARVLGTPRRGNRHMLHADVVDIAVGRAS